MERAKLIDPERSLIDTILAKHEQFKLQPNNAAVKLTFEELFAALNRDELAIAQ